MLSSAFRFPTAAGLMLCVAAFLAPVVPAAGPGPALSPGTYLTDGGWGRLEIRESAPAVLRFDLRAEGPNGHSCGLGGEIVAGVARLVPGDGRDVCQVSFRVVGDRIEVVTNGVASCRDHCGARAAFEGRYVRRAASCSEGRRRQARKEFRRDYDAGRHAAAAGRLQPLVDECVAALPWHEAGWIRNDLALAQLKAGDPAGCLKTLEPLQADAARTEADIRRDMPPSDASRLLAIARATRTNQALCTARAAR